MKAPRPTVPLDPLTASMPFYGRTRLVKGGPWVACRMWSEEDRDPETGELLSDVVYHVEIDGEEVFFRGASVPFWPWHPITEAEYRYMIDDARWCRQYRPGHPKANPRAPIDKSQLELF